jgi:hypothetical protein
VNTYKSLAVVAALLAGGTSLAIAQNGPATGGEPPVAGGAALETLQRRLCIITP